MATNVRQILQTLGEVLQWLAPYTGGSVPASTTTDYADLVRWIQLGQQDAANRKFWRRLLIPEDVTITKDIDYINLPARFFKINGLYSLLADNVDWADNNNEDQQIIYVYMNPDDGTWRAKFTGFTPTETVTAKLWYFYNPPKPTQESDPLYLDGEMIGFYALKEYHRKQGELGSLDDARIEYENRIEELAALEAIPSRQELLQWSDQYKHLGQPRNERAYYSGGGRHGRRQRI